MEIQIGPWRCDVDVPATAAAYRRTRGGAPADCRCEACAFFARRADDAFPPAFRAWLREAGADAARAAEVHESGRGSGGTVVYAGWFHVAGMVAEGPPAEAEQWHPREPWFSLRVDARRDRAFPEFGARPLVRIEFVTELGPEAA